MKPFLKWAGGKRQLVPVIKKYLPSNYKVYYEPFIGGGALFFDLKPKKAFISDINSELITTYKVIKNKVEELLKLLKNNENTEEYFYKIRELNPSELSDIERANRMIFLNHTCFNGLYRENSKGKFNVPFGKYKNPHIFDEENLKNISNYLKSSDIQIHNIDYKDALLNMESEDFAYLDPPYHPLNAKSFTKYSKNDFSEKDQMELSHEFDNINKKGAYAILSNSNTDFIKNLYNKFEIMEVVATRNINRNGLGRKAETIEVIIKNYMV